MTQVYAALAHVHITQGRAVRLCVTRAVHLVVHPGSSVLAETPDTRGTSGGVTLRRFYGIRLYRGYPLSSERDTLVDAVTNHPELRGPRGARGRRRRRFFFFLSEIGAFIIHNENYQPRDGAYRMYV